jgi:hypothetical protein
MTNRDGVVSYQDFFDNEAYDSLALDYVQRFSGTAQANKERCQGLGKAQECSPVCGLISDRLQFCANRALALAQHRQFPSQALFALFRWIGRACYCKPAVEFLLD